MQNLKMSNYMDIRTHSFLPLCLKRKEKREVSTVPGALQKENLTKYSTKGEKSQEVWISSSVVRMHYSRT